MEPVRDDNIFTANASNFPQVPIIVFILDRSANGRFLVKLRSIIYIDLINFYYFHKTIT